VVAAARRARPDCCAAGGCQSAGTRARGGAGVAGGRHRRWLGAAQVTGRGRL